MPLTPRYSKFPRDSGRQRPSPLQNTLQRAVSCFLRRGPTHELSLELWVSRVLPEAQTHGPNSETPGKVSETNLNQHYLPGSPSEAGPKCSVRAKRKKQLQETEIRFQAQLVQGSREAEGRKQDSAGGGEGTSGWRSG